MPKMMLQATQTSCLKDSHTNFQMTQELVFHTFEADCNSYAKTSDRNIRTSCLKYAHTNIFSTQELVLNTLEATLVRAKNDAASNTNQLFKIQSYKFTKIHRNWYKILWRLLEFVCQKITLPATSNSCLKYRLGVARPFLMLEAFF